MGCIQMEQQLYKWSVINKVKVKLYDNYSKNNNAAANMSE